MKIIQPTSATLELTPEEKMTLQTAGEILISLHKEIELSSYRVLVAENSQVSLYEIGKNAKFLFGLANEFYSIQ
jgi:hypothetical protein